MPPIEQSEFLQRFMTMLDAAGTPAPAPQAKGLAGPMAALDAAPRPFAEVYGPRTRLLAQAAALAKADDDPGLAGLMSALDEALREGTLQISAGPNTAPRLSRFVYPVI